MEICETLNRGAKRGPGTPFPKGRSGNPRGRPRKVAPVVEVLKIERRSVSAMLRAAAFAPVQVAVGDSVLEVAALEAAAREVAMQAAGGDRMALVTLTRLMASHADEEEEDEEEPEAAPTTPEVETAEAYKRAWSAAIASAGTWVTDLPVPIPHPDEIVIDRRVRAAAGDASRWVAVPMPHPDAVIVDRRTNGVRYSRDLEPRQEATIARLRDWLPALTTAWDAIEDAWGRTRLHEVRMKLEPQQKRIEQARAIVEQGLAEWDRRHPPREADAGATPPDRGAEDSPVTDRERPVVAQPPTPARATDEKPARPVAPVAEALAYKEAVRRALEVSHGSFFDMRPPRPLPHLVIVDAGKGSVGYTARLGRHDGATIANLRRWPSRLEALAAGVEAEIAGARCEGDRIRLSARQRMIEQTQDLVEEALADWDAGGSDTG